MRDIKFRAWDTKKQQMTGLEFAVTAKGSWLLKDLSLSKETWVREKTHRLIPMQWTGLLDKNGKEIYQGDIVLKPNKHGFGPIKIIERSEHVAAFTWGREFLYLSTASLKLEIIGNIYENLNLLTTT